MPSSILAEASLNLQFQLLAWIIPSSVETVRNLFKSDLLPKSMRGGLGSFKDRRIWERKSVRAVNEDLSVIE